MASVMGGGWITTSIMAALVLLAGGCARKDRVAPCAPGEGLVSAYAAADPVVAQSRPFGSTSFFATDPCGPLRLVNATPRINQDEE